MTIMTRRRNFIITPGQVEQLSDDHENDMASWLYDEPSLYDELILAGYPATDDPSLGGYFIDLSVDPGDLTDVTVYPSGADPLELSMGPASGLFLGWYAVNVSESEDDNDGE